MLLLLWLSLRPAIHNFRRGLSNTSTRSPQVPKLNFKMTSHAGPMTVTFLGTSSGGGPSESRNCSSLVAEVLGDGSLWMYDCAEGTTRQFALQPGYGAQRVKISRVTKIFITHMHADHTMGIVPVLRNVLLMPKPEPDTSDKLPKIEIYGPAGIRKFIRTILQMTLTNTGDRYVVHELLNRDDEVTPCSPEVMHSSECVGRDIRASEDGFWTDILYEKGVSVDAGPIQHRDPCLGYIIREAPPMSRKIVILGDTNDPNAIIPLCINPSPSLLIHEATDAFIPSTIDPNAKRSQEIVEAKCKERGHSTPAMAGTFAKLIGARQLVLNHIGSRFPAPQNSRRNARELRMAIMGEIERQASQTWEIGRAQAAMDYMTVCVTALRLEDTDKEGNIVEDFMGGVSMEQNAGMVINQRSRGNQGGRGGNRGRYHGRRGRGYHGGAGGSDGDRRDHSSGGYRGVKRRRETNA